ncbi:MAG TPA: hypothetical protein VI749_05810 [Candidatus Omnitrophota bacterium]|nr:hypothetical protein [Candidatus Omnitrophota bacterium]
MSSVSLMRLYNTNKRVISFKNNPVPFLNGLTSNDMQAPHNALLNIHGKIIATFAQAKINDDEFWICVEELYVPAVHEHLQKYVALARVQMSVLDQHVYYDLDGEYPLEKDEVAIPQRKGRLIITPRHLTADVTEEQFTVFRLKNNIPQMGIDYKDDFILNVCADDFVSFTKGCFLGQEPVSKVYNRSKPTWKLIVKYEGECTDEERAKMTSKATDKETARTMGFVFVKN